MREEQRAVIQFLGSEGEKPADIHRRMKRQYGDTCVSLQQVYEWHRKFKSGVSTLTDAAHLLLEHYMPRGLTINSESYCDLLQNHLKPEIRSKHHGLLNTCPHTVRATAKKITDLRLECIPQPAYSPDLAPSDYHVFGPLKEALGGKKFSMDDEIKEAVHRWLRSQSEEFFLVESRH
jgi:histone-lysine N-methyltransferase SETMAR